MRLYIECFYADGSQILGNGEGQASLGEITDYKKTDAYKLIKRIVGKPGWKVVTAKVVDQNGKVLETIS